MDSREVIEAIVDLITGGEEPNSDEGREAVEVSLGEGWKLDEVRMGAPKGANNWFELTTPDGSVHHVFAIRVR